MTYFHVMLLGPGCNLTVRKYTIISSFHWLISLSFILSTIWHAGASYLNLKEVGFVMTSAKRMLVFVLEMLKSADARL